MYLDTYFLNLISKYSKIINKIKLIVNIIFYKILIKILNFEKIKQRKK